jgi:hypothetical protein
MPEDAQPNDLRGRSAAGTGISSIRSARNIPKPRDWSSLKRPSDRSYTTSPAKRRRLDEPAPKEIIRTLPPACRKGVAGCHRERKDFIAQEIQLLEKSEHGLKVVSYTIHSATVRFVCTQVDILNCSLAPSTPPAKRNHESPKAQSQPKVSQFCLCLFGL